MTENLSIPPLVGISVTESSTDVSNEPTQALESPRAFLTPPCEGGKPNRFSQRRRAAGMYKPKVVTPPGANGFSAKDATEGFHQVKSHVSRIRVGFADTVGRRPTNEDQIVIIGEQYYDVVAVFDGHNGPLVSGFISENLRHVMGEMLEPTFGERGPSARTGLNNNNNSPHEHQPREFDDADASANSRLANADEDTKTTCSTTVNDSGDATHPENNSESTHAETSDASPVANTTEEIAPNNNSAPVYVGDATAVEKFPVVVPENNVANDDSPSIQSHFCPIFRRLNDMIRDGGIVGGATALVLAFTDESIIVANAGDCRCVVGRGDVAERVTTDHKPSDPREQARIEQQGGCVIIRHNDNGTTTARVNGVLSVARAMGDFELADYITCEPDVFRLPSDKLTENYFVIACDGLWDVVDDRVAIKTVTDWLETHDDDVQGAAKKLVDIAFLSGSTDNISVVVVKK